MLRAAVIAIGGLLIAAGGILAVSAPAGWPAAVWLAVVGVLTVGGTIFERRYRSRTPTGNAQPTGERFIDPTSGKLVDVTYDPRTGERFYPERERNR